MRQYTITDERLLGLTDATAVGDLKRKKVRELLTRQTEAVARQIDARDQWRKDRDAAAKAVEATRTPIKPSGQCGQVGCSYKARFFWIGLKGIEYGCTRHSQNGWVGVLVPQPPEIEEADALVSKLRIELRKELTGQ